MEQIRKKGLKATPARMEVMKAMGNAPVAYSHGEMKLLFNTIDQVTIFRILKDFENAGLVHKIIDLEGVTRFALCRPGCPDEHHQDRHVHFNCKACHKMFCLEKVEAPVINIPAGFKETRSQTVIYGFCDKCNVS